jgi:hypothetical protein
MSKIRFVMLTVIFLSLLYCDDAQNVDYGYIDGSHSCDVESFWGKLVNKVKLETEEKYNYKQVYIGLTK